MLAAEGMVRLYLKYNYKIRYLYSGFSNVV